MRTTNIPWKRVEQALRQTVPPLQPVDLGLAEQAVTYAFAHECPRKMPWADLFAHRTMLRAAASFALVLLGIALLLQTRPCVTGSAGLPNVFPDQVSAFTTAVVDAPVLETALVTEADNLADDLADLTREMNQRTFALLP